MWSVMVAVMAMLMATGLASSATAGVVWNYHGVVFGGGEWTAAGEALLGSAGANASLAAAANAGAGAIRVIPTWYVDNVNSTAVYRNPVRTCTRAHRSATEI